MGAGPLAEAAVSSPLFQQESHLAVGAISTTPIIVFSAEVRTVGLHYPILQFADRQVFHRITNL